MFGIEKQEKKEKIPKYRYQLERELEDPLRSKEIVGLVEERLLQIKKELENQFDDEINILLQGYLCLKRVVAKEGKK